MITFSDIIHPKHGLSLRFKYKPRAFQYLDYFNIITYSPNYKFVPLDLMFESIEELYQFLYNRGIVHNEIEVSDTFWKTWDEPTTIVETRKIYDVKRVS